MVQRLEDAFHDLVEALKDAQGYGTNVAEIAEVVSYSGSTADVLPLVDDAGGRDEVGVINECPILVTALIAVNNGKLAVRELKKGDNVLIVFNNRDLDNYSKGKFSKSSDRMHDVNDAIVVGVIKS